MSEHEEPEAAGTAQQREAEKQGTSQQEPYPTYRKEQFLLIEVPRGASRTEFMNQIEKALRLRDVPFFRDNLAPSQRAKGRAEARSQEQYPDAAKLERRSTSQNDRWGEDELDKGLLILVKTEGWPPER